MASMHRVKDIEWTGTWMGRSLAANLPHSWQERLADLQKGFDSRPTVASSRLFNCSILNPTSWGMIGPVPIRSSCRLFYFARAPRFPLAGGILELEDGLWSEAPALCSRGTGRRDGLRLVSIHNASPVRGLGTLRVFRFHSPSQGNER